MVMKSRFLNIFTVAAILGSIATTVTAKTKKNDVDKKEVEKILKEVGGEHYVEGMKVRNLCTLEFEDEAADESVYYHFYVAALRKGGYHLVVFDNKPEYLGYYLTNYEPSEYNETEVMLDSGESDEDGNTTWYTIPFTMKGPADKIRIDGTPVTFAKNPKRVEEAKEGAEGGTTALVIPEKQKSASGEVIDYRDWTITMGGQERTVNAIFEKIEGGKVYIKSSKNGAVAGVPGSSLSQEDQEYIRRITK